VNSSKTTFLFSAVVLTKVCADNPEAKAVAKSKVICFFISFFFKIYAKRIYDIYFKTHNKLCQSKRNKQIPLI